MMALSTDGLVVISGWSSASFVALLVEVCGDVDVSCSGLCEEPFRKGDRLGVVRVGDRLSYFHFRCLPGRFLSRASGSVRWRGFAVAGVRSPGAGKPVGCASGRRRPSHPAVVRLRA